MTSTVEALRGTTATVVGDVMLDRYVWGAAERISPEAPVPVLRVDERSTCPGGAANAAANMVALGGSVVIAGVVGDDDAGQELTSGLVSLGVDVAGLVIEAGRPTTTKTRYYAQGQQLLRADVERPAAVGGACERSLVDLVSARRADVIVISDYAKGVVTETLAKAVIEGARARGRPVVVDPKGRSYAKYAGASVVTPNQGELASAVNFDVATDDDVVDAARRLAEDLGGDTAILVTRGAAGMTLVAGRDVLHIPTASESVYDVTGAGDTVLATIALAMGAGLDLAFASRLANRAAAIAVSRVGAATVTADELAAAAGES